MRRTRRSVKSKRAIIEERNFLGNVEKKINTSIDKLSKHIKQKANFKTIQKDNNEILLLLGECNYLARQWWSQEQKLKRETKTKRPVRRKTKKVTRRKRR